MYFKERLRIFQRAVCGWKGTLGQQVKTARNQSAWRNRFPA